MTLKGRPITNKWVAVTPDAIPRKRRTVAIIGGMEKTGKDTLAISGYGPVYVLGIDRGCEVVAQRSAGRNIFLKQYVSPKELDPSNYQSTWAQFKADYYEVLKANQGSLVVDTETAMYELARLSHFGKLTQVTPEQYGPLNTEINAMVDAAFDSDMSVIFIRRTRAVYVGRQNTGQYEDAGWPQMPFAVEMRIWTYRCAKGMCQTTSKITGQILHPNGEGFHARIRDSRWKNDVMLGSDWSADPTNFTPIIDHQLQTIIDATM